MSEPITVLVPVRNEAANIRRCLSALAPADEIVVLDSGSSDDTARIATEEFDAKVLQFDYNGEYPKKRQWALNTYDFKHDWVLLVDADEIATDSLWQEIHQVLASPQHDGYLITKQFHFLGRAFQHGGFSHSAVLLLNRHRGRFEETLAELDSGTDMEVHERLIIDGSIGKLASPVLHEDYKGLNAYIARHNQYSTWEAMLRYRYLTTGSYSGDAIKPSLFGDSQARRRFLKHLLIRLPLEPWIWFFYHYLFNLGFLEGKPGLIAAQLRANHFREVRAKLYEMQQSEA